MEFSYEELIGLKGWLYSRYVWKYVNPGREHLMTWEEFRRRYENEPLVTKDNDGSRATRK